MTFSVPHDEHIRTDLDHTDSHLTELTDTEFTGADLAGVFAGLTYTALNEDLADNQRWSTWTAVERGARGPYPRPDWVVTDDSAVDTELGVLKTGKEADVYLVERAVQGDDTRSVVMAAKRYRNEQHRSFHRSTSYTEGRRTRNTRDARAMAKGSSFGREVAAGQWAQAEFSALVRLWELAVPVPYPVQVDGTELLLELIAVDGHAAPRLAQARCSRSQLDGYFEQLRDAMHALARAGLAHGDLSAFNLLAQGDRLVIIDLPQVIDLVANPQGMDFLLRDCRNVCNWFASRGLDVDADELFSELLASAF
jgi:RIO kinase 1